LLADKKIAKKLRQFRSFIPVDQWGSINQLVDQWGVDQLGVDQLGVDQLGVDQSGVDQWAVDH
jgi:hypothetical protein